MKYGVYLPNFGPFSDAQLLATLAVDAENSGWDGFFIWDHIAGPIVVPFVDPWVALTLIAIKTKRIKIGTLITPIPRRRPWKLARETVSIDHLSQGRLILGVGTGLGKYEWDDLGEQIEPKKRGLMLDEALKVLVGLWSGEEYSFLGEYYHINKVCFLPKPLQEPRIPIWVGGVWPNKAPFQRAIKWDGAFPYFFTDTEEQEFQQLEESVRYLEKIQEFNRPFEIICAGVTPDADSDETISIIKRRKSLGVTWWLESINPLRFNMNFDSDWPINALRDRILHGPPLDP